MHVRDTLEIQHMEAGVETADRHGATSHGKGRRGLGGERKNHTDTKNNATTRMHKCKSCSESVTRHASFFWRPYSATAGTTAGSTVPLSTERPPDDAGVLPAGEPVEFNE
jgi:hypothetical protein